MSAFIRFFLTLVRLIWLAWLTGARFVWRWLSSLLGFGEAAPATPAPAAQPLVTPEMAPPGQFLAGVFKNEAGERDYKLFIPPGERVGLRPLLVMLHGCTQNPDDFALGTGMNELAQAHNCLVLYPAQSRVANNFLCWNWFDPRNQQREGGEPAIIAGMVRQVSTQYGADPQRTYAAGLSAGAAMAVTLAHTHPELFAAVGAHSGLPYAAAQNMMGALVVMKHGGGQRQTLPGQSPVNGVEITVPLIVFHGDKDATVHSSNGLQLIVQAGFTPVESVDNLVTNRPEGYAYTSTLYRDAGGATQAEHWSVHGAGHAWSGGNRQASYTDPLGPDASAEFLRFFLARTRGVDANLI